VLDAAGSPTARIVAFVVPADPGGGAPDVADLRGFLADRLPAYMVPERLVAVDRLPLSPSGKLDRAPLLASVPPPERPAYIQPRGELVRAVAAIWSEVLEVDAVGTADNFFDLGGHSLLLAQVQARIGERLGREVPIVEFFEHPTVESLARHLRDAHPVDAPAAPAAGRDRGRLRRQAVRPRARDDRPGERP
jgi:acyl carrier protein